MDRFWLFIEPLVLHTWRLWPCAIRHRVSMAWRLADWRRKHGITHR